MTWLHLSIPIMGAAALYSAHHAGLCFGVAAAILDKAGLGPEGRSERRPALVPLLSLARKGRVLLDVDPNFLRAPGQRGSARSAVNRLRLTLESGTST